jgi:hypothetical protein
MFGLFVILSARCIRHLLSAAYKKNFRYNLYLKVHLEVLDLSSVEATFPEREHRCAEEGEAFAGL